MLTMWKEHVSAPLNFVHLGFGFGAVFANFLVKPYLQDEHRHFSTDVSLSTLDSSLIYRSNLSVPYNVTSILCLMIGIGHLLIYIRERHVNVNSI